VVVLVRGAFFLLCPPTFYPLFARRGGRKPHQLHLAGAARQRRNQRKDWQRTLPVAQGQRKNRRAQKGSVAFEEPPTALVVAVPVALATVALVPPPVVPVPVAFAVAATVHTALPFLRTGATRSEPSVFSTRPGLGVAIGPGRRG
jgi:hypothetical protein